MSMADATESRLEPPRSPIVLGIAGHADPRPEDLPALRDAFAAILADFRARYPHTPIIVMSTLARGADQVAAGVALEAGDDVRVVAPLPFPAEVYARSTSFGDDDAARGRMLGWVSDPSLAGKKLRSYVVDAPDSPDPDDLAAWTELIQDEHRRHVAYANAGGYILRHCHALVAFWDGHAATRPSGTAEMVECKRRGRALALDPWRTRLPLLNADADGPVYVIHTPRAGRTGSGSESGSGSGSGSGDPASPARRPGERRVLMPGPEVPVVPADLDWKLGTRHRFARRVAEALTLHPHAGEHEGHGAAAAPANPADAAQRDARRARDEFRQFHETCRTVEDFNRDAAARAALIEPSLARLPGSELGEDLAAADAPAPMLRLLRLRVAAAELARHYDRLFNAVLIALFLILFLAAACFHVYAHLESESAPGVHNPAWLAAFAGLLLLDGLLVCVVWITRLGERRHDYRALAEALRVRIYWGLAGIGKSVADSYLNQLRSEMSWTRRAVQCAAPPPAYWDRIFRAKAPAEQVELLRRVGRQWVDRQARYFHERFHRHHRGAARLRQFGFILAFTGWLIVVALVATLGIPRAVGGRVEPGHGSDAADPAGHREVGEGGFWDASHPSPWLLIGSGILVLSGAILIAYCERRSHEELARQYERMWVVFRRGSDQLGEHLQASDVESAQRVLKILGHEAAAEHAQWLILRRNRPFELLIH